MCVAGPTFGPFSACCLLFGRGTSRRTSALRRVKQSHLELPSTHCPRRPSYVPDRCCPPRPSRAVSAAPLHHWKQSRNIPRVTTSAINKRKYPPQDKSVTINRIVDEIASCLVCMSERADLDIVIFTVYFVFVCSRVHKGAFRPRLL